MTDFGLGISLTQQAAGNELSEIQTVKYPRIVLDDLLVLRRADAAAVFERRQRVELSRRVGVAIDSADRLAISDPSISSAINHQLL